MERKFSFMSAACLQENWVNLCTGKDLQGGVKNRRNQSFIFYVRRGERKEKNPFCCWIYSARLLLSIRSCKFMVVGTKSFFFLLSRVTGTVKFDWSANFDPLKESVLNLTFTKEKKKMVKFYIAELYNLFPSFELAWLLSFCWEWGYKFWRKKPPLKSDMQKEVNLKLKAKYAMIDFVPLSTYFLHLFAHVFG